MARIFTVGDGLNPKDMIHAALDHAGAAESLFKVSPSYFDSAGYLAHISAELILKAWLLEAIGKFEGIHSLRALHRLLEKSTGVPALTADGIAALTLLDSYEHLRYPNVHAPTEVGGEHWKLIRQFIDGLIGQLPGRLQEELQSLDPLRKGGRVLMEKKIEP